MAGPGNCAVVGDRSFVWARTARGSFVLPARCPHRGGPLHLARLSADGGRLLCPWHGSATSLSRLLKTGVPAVRRGEEVTAVLPDAGDTPYSLEHRPLSRDLRTAPPAGTTAGRP